MSVSVTEQHKDNCGKVRTEAMICRACERRLYRIGLSSSGSKGMTVGPVLEEDGIVSVVVFSVGVV